MGRRFKALIGVGAVTLALVSASLAWAVVAGPTKVLGGRGSQMLPAATPGGSFLSWTLIRSGQVAELAERFQAGDIDLSMTHSRGMAAAVAIVHPR